MTSRNGPAEDGTSRKICYVIMPISDPAEYESGHFSRVYEHIIKPACLVAGYDAVRADDTNKTNYIVVDILRAVLDSAIVLCDMSARNPNVFYELGIRHAFNRPTVLIKDNVTEKVFDIQGLRYQEYDRLLRVDTVRRDVEMIAKSLRETAESTAKDVNSIIQFLGIEPATPPKPVKLSDESSLILAALSDISQRIARIEGAASNNISKAELRRVQMPDGIIAEVGLDVEMNNKLYGKIVDIHPNEIYIELPTGAVERIYTQSKRFRSLSTHIPF